MTALVCSSSLAWTASLLLGIENEINFPGRAPGGTVITTLSGMPGMVSLSLLPGFVFGGTWSSYVSSSSSMAGVSAGGTEGAGASAAVGGGAAAAPCAATASGFGGSAVEAAGPSSGMSICTRLFFVDEKSRAISPQLLSFAGAGCIRGKKLWNFV